MQVERGAVQPDQELEDKVHSLYRGTIEEVLRHVEDQDHTQLVNNLELIHASDIADLLEQLST